MFKKNKSSIDWQLFLPMPMNVKTALAYVIGQNEAIVTDIHSGYGERITKNQAYHNHRLSNRKVVGLGSKNGFPILYVND